MKRSPLRRKTPLRRGQKPLQRRSKISPVSRPRAKQMRVYGPARRAFLLAHPHCQAGVCHRTGCTGKSRDVHHRSGRRGATLLDQSRWLAVSRCCHSWIEANGREARELGLILPDK